MAPNVRITLKQQPDGNLVRYGAPHTALRSSQIAGTGVPTVMQPDGDVASGGSTAGHVPVSGLPARGSGRCPCRRNPGPGK